MIYCISIITLFCVVIGFKLSNTTPEKIMSAIIIILISIMFVNMRGDRKVYLSKIKTIEDNYDLKLKKVQEEYYAEVRNLEYNQEEKVFKRIKLDRSKEEDKYEYNDSKKSNTTTNPFGINNSRKNKPSSSSGKSYNNRNSGPYRPNRGFR